MMRIHRTLSGLGLFIVLNGSAFAGPDLICSEIASATSFGFVDGKVAYSFGTTLCNIGDAELPWDANTNQHPLISQTLYKLKDHQLTQIGIGFVRHTTIPLASNACGLGCTPAGFDALGIGCSDTSSSSINGAQGLMGPRTEINAFTGDYPYPFTAINQTGNAIYKRLQVNLADVSDPAALYFVETQVSTSAEIDAQTRSNNVSYRQVVFSPGSANASLVGPTYTEQPAIFAWRDHGNGIGIPDNDVMITESTIPGDGVIHVGSRATDMGDGTWRYDYAVHNQNAENAILSLVVPGAGFFDGVSNATFHDVNYHDDLDGLLDATDVPPSSWSISTYWRILPIRATSNVVRWGTTYSYSFVVAGGNDPRSLHTILEYDIPGVTNSKTPLLAEAIVPNLGDVCHADILGDGHFDFHDISVFIQDFVVGDPRADFNPDGVYDFFDISGFLNSYATECP